MIGKRKKRNGHNLSLAQKLKLLWLHEDKCVYCTLPLTIEVMVCDHFTPYKVFRSNSIHCMVPSCWNCNSIKSALVFSTLADAQHYVNTQRKLRNMPYVSNYIRENQGVEEILLVDLPHEVLVGSQSSTIRESATDRARQAEAFLAKRYGKSC